MFNISTILEFQLTAGTLTPPSLVALLTKQLLNKWLIENEHSFCETE